MDDDLLLPEVRAAHGIAQQRRRGGKPALSLDRIVDAAMALADEDGLAAVSMARVAARLGYTTMSLYRHVGSKDELLAHMQDAGLPRPPADLAATTDWRTGLRRWTEAQTAAAIDRPWVLDIPVTGPPLMPNSLAWMEAAMSLMAELPLSGMEKIALLTLLAGHARSEATTTVNMRRAYAERGIGAEDEGPLYERAMLRLTADGRFPLLHAMAAAGELFSMPPGVADEDADAYYASFPIERILDGVAAYVAGGQAVGS